MKMRTKFLGCNHISKIKERILKDIEAVDIYLIQKIQKYIALYLKYDMIIINRKRLLFDKKCYYFLNQ